MNSVYAKDLAPIAENFEKYYPENLNSETVSTTNNIINVINESLQLGDSKKIKNYILRWQIFNDYLKNSSDSKVFKQAISYAKNLGDKNYTQRAGQYLLNMELVNNYPSSKEMVSEPEIFEKIMDKLGDNKNKATKLLCKYQDYIMLDKTKQKSILEILKIFDAKNADDKVILKNIIENDYVKQDTSINNTNLHNTKIVFVNSAKKEILSKYKFPRCVEFYRDFEEAMPLIANDTGSAGVKITGTNNDALEYKMEVKIKGYTDRLFSSKNNYVFDIYSEKGLHY